MKVFLKKLTALALSMAMILPLFTAGLVPHVQAAGTGTGTAKEHEGGNFSDQTQTMRPNLYVDFLGDNAGHKTGETPTPTATGTLKDPEFESFSDPAITGESRDKGNWPGYDSTLDPNDTIFWVGVGIDQLNALKLLEDNVGLYSAELAFYYNSDYIEPYTGGGTFRSVIETANVGTNYAGEVWGNNFEVIDAQFGIAPQTDEITAEVIGNYAGYINHALAPNMDMGMIMGTDPDAPPVNPWKMTYVSIERKETENDNANRFKGRYDPDAPDDETEYLLIIPFVLKQYDPDTRLCLRLARNATHFSVGAGSAGDDVYAAWERVTTRNPESGHSMKLMTNFTGDLNIFTGMKVPDNRYDLRLEATLAGDPVNAAVLTITDDPSPTPISARVGTFYDNSTIPATTTMVGERTIEGLSGGIGMTLKLTVNTGYTATVKVIRTGATDEVYTIVVKDQEHYTFLMPEHDTTVQVVFTLTGATEFPNYLVENRAAEVNIPSTATGRVPGNYAKITSPTSPNPFIDSDTTFSTGSGPSILLADGLTPTVQIDLHPDYEAEVYVHTLGATVADVSLGTLPTGMVEIGTTGHYIVSQSLSFTYTTQQRGIQVEVIYRPAETKKATLEVHHDDPIEIPPSSGIYQDLEHNVAQLSYPAYTTHTTATAHTVYSGVVYNQNYGVVGTEDNSAVEAISGSPRILDGITQAAANRSKALGGDGVETPPAAWDATSTGDLMQDIFAATTLTIADLPAFTAFQLKEWGVRRNAKGAYFTTATEVDAFKTRLLELRNLAASGGTPNDSLTLNQVQAYIIDWDNHNEDATTYPTAAAWKADGFASSQVTALGWPTLGSKMENLVWPAGEIAPGSAGTPPPPDATLEARPGRQMTLTLESTSSYIVKEIRLIDQTAGTPAADIVVYPDAVNEYVNRVAGMENVYTFKMPAYDCVVKVIYTARPIHNVNLVVSGLRPETTANKVTVAVHQPQDATGTHEGIASQVKRQAVTANGTTVFADVLGRSTVTGTVVVEKNYSATINVFTADSSATTIYTQAIPASATAAQTVNFSFTMEQDTPVQISVTYQPPASTPKTARLNVSTLVTPTFGNSALWMQNSAGTWTVTGSNMRSETPGNDMRAQISVASGYYIYSVLVVSDGISYPYTLTGNGYNGGSGGTVELHMVMPPENTEVYVVFRPGPPPVEPEYAMRVVVDDPNTGTPLSTAKLSVPSTSMTSPALDKTTAPAATPWVTYVNAGREVIVDLTPASGYYVADVAVTPAALGVVVEWLSPTRVKFISPAADSLVTVTFAAGTAPTHYLNLDTTQSGGAADRGANAIRTVRSTILDAATSGGYTVPNPMPAGWTKVPDTTTYGAAHAGDPVTLYLTVKAGWHLDSVTVWSAGGTVPVTLSVTDGGYNSGSGVVWSSYITASFIMPNGETWVVANYRTGQPPTDPKEHAVTLRVEDPDNLDDGTPSWAPADNWAYAEISGVTTGRIPTAAVPATPTVDEALGFAKPAWSGTPPPRPVFDVGYAAAGDRVEVTYDADTDYTLEVIIVTPAGLSIVPTYLGGGKAAFTMPDSAVTVEVRFRKGDPNLYRADLILRPPAGTSIADCGAGTFTPGGSLDPSGLPPVYSINAEPGEWVSFDLFAEDGYYIRAVEVTPASLGVATTYTGSFGAQSGGFIMPAGNVYVNVYYEKAWPDEAKYSLTLAVNDPYKAAAPTTANSSYGRLSTLNGTAIAAGVDVFGGESQTLSAATKDKDEVFVRLTPIAGKYIEDISVTTAAGVAVPWQYAVRQISGSWVSGIVFTVPAASVTVEVTFGETVPATFDINAEVRNITAADGEVVVTDHSGTPSAITLDDTTTTDTITGVTVGTHISLEIDPPDTGNAVVAVWAVGVTTGAQLIFPTAQVTGGGTAHFAMPAEDVEIVVVYGTAPGTDEYPAILTVSGPSGAGKAVMSDDTDPAPVTTGDVLAGTSGMVYALQGAEMLVTVVPAANHYIKRVEVRDSFGNPVSFAWDSGGYNTATPPVWVANPDKEFTFTMPPFAAYVHVVLAEIPSETFNAQLVVNDDAYTGTGTSENGAKLIRVPAATTGDTDTLIPNLNAGDGVYLDVTVHPGYKIGSIVVVSQQHGIVMELPLGPMEDQRTSFLMPAADVVVYVKFVADGLTRYDATLVVDPGGSVISGNEATIHSAYSGTKGPIDTGSEIVQAAAVTEWVTVEYNSVANSYAEVTVLDSNGDPVPFTQVAMLVPGGQGGKITFPMLPRAVTVTVEYVAAQPTFDLNLHVVDLSGTAAAGSWARLTWTTEDTMQTFALPDPGATATIRVPAGAPVTLNATAAGGNYIQAAYVLYTAGGQLIEMNLAADTSPNLGFSGSKTERFIMHPGEVDVYVYFTDAPPTATERAAVLTVTGPADDAISLGRMWVNADEAGAVTAPSNGAHAYTVAKQGDTITVQMTVADDLMIDYILMTPLGIAVTPVRVGNRYTFTMPAENVGIHIHLRETSANDFTATLHVAMSPSTLFPATGDKAEISAQLADGSTIKADVDGGSITVTAGTTVDVKARLSASHLVLAAYVLQGTRLVPLTTALEGTVRTAAGSGSDPLAWDGLSAFTMPFGDVDVYIFLTNTPPSPDPWNTAVLIVTDVDSAGTENSTKNSATIKGSTTPLNNTAVRAYSDGGHKFITVVGGDTVTVSVDLPAADGYTYSSGMLTTSPTGATTLSGGPPAPFTYQIPVLPTPGYNSAVHIHFASQAVVTSNLTVRVEDGDNPGDGSTTNKVVVTPPGTLLPLTVLSTTPAGAWQVIPGVALGGTVTFAVTPEAGYFPVAFLETGTSTTPLTLTPAPNAASLLGGTAYSGNFAMPSAPSTLRVVLYRAYDATLVLEEWNPDGSYAILEEQTFGQTAQVTDAQKSDTIENLPNTTLLETTPTLGVNSRLLSVLASTAGGTQSLPLTGGVYPYTIAREDVEIRVITAAKANTTTFIAAARIVGPDYGGSVTIENTTQTTAGNTVWVQAEVTDTVTVTVNVPTDYRAELTDDAGNILSATALAATGSVTLTMPAQDVNVTVRFYKTNPSLTLTLEGATGTDVAMLAGTFAGGTLTANVSTATITALSVAAGSAIGYSATPDTGASPAKAVSAVLLTANGSTTALLPLSIGSFTMPEYDATVTVVFMESGAATPDTPYVAVVETVGDDGLPYNTAQQIVNQTAPQSSGVNWAVGVVDDGMQFTFTTEPGYYATVTAVEMGTATPVPVVQLGSTGTGTAYITMPAANVQITVTYSTTPPPPATRHDLTLTLVGADGKDKNLAKLVYPLLSGGTASLDANGDTVVTVTQSAAAATGDSLQLSTAAESGYVVGRITVTVGGSEQNIPFNRYGNTANALLNMPGGNATVKVYFTKVYQATLRIYDSTTSDTATLSEPVSAQSVNTDGGVITNLGGGEEMHVAATAGTDRRIVGVLLTTKAGVTHIAFDSTDSRYEFTMPEEDVVVSVIFEDEPTSGDPKSHVAKIRFTSDSEGQTETGNGVAIKNSSDTAAASGTYWAEGIKGDTMTVTVHVAAGYQAEITTVYADSDTTTELYITRRVILPTGTAGKTAVFTMPDDDATVFIRYIKGYTATLELVDSSGSAHVAEMEDDRTTGAVTITGTSAAGAVGTVSAVTYASTDPADSTSDSIPGLPSGTQLDVDAGTIAANETLRIVTTTAFGGTATDISPTLSTTTTDFLLPAQDTTATVIIRDDSDHNGLLAKVALAGDSDIAGNQAQSIEDISTPATTPPPLAGTVWTTTQEDGVIEVIFTVASGYIAQVEVFTDTALAGSTPAPIDDALYDTAADVTATPPVTPGATSKSYGYNAPANAAAADMVKEFKVYFEMVNEDVTVIITYAFAGQLPAPYDPDRLAASTLLADEDLKDGYIYGINRRDYADVTVPTLATNATTLYSVTDDGTSANAAVSTAVNGEVTFRFYILDDDSGEHLPLVEGVDVTLVPVDSSNTTDPYDYDTYYSAGTDDYLGARFKLIPKGNPAATASVQEKALIAMLDNDGSVESDKKTRLFVKAIDESAQESVYTEVLIRPYFGITVQVYSHGPRHVGTAALYAYDTTGGTDPMDPADYETTAAFEQDFSTDTILSAMVQQVGVYSSELFGDPVDPSFATNAPTFLLQISKPGHITYTRVEMTLDRTAGTAGGYYNATTQLFTVSDPITLIPGDVDGVGIVSLSDRNIVNDYIDGYLTYSTDTLPADTNWATSIYNPATEAYRADLDSNGRITLSDRAILMGYIGYGADQYLWEDTATPGTMVLPHGFDTTGMTITPLATAEELELFGIFLPVTEESEDEEEGEDTDEENETPPPDDDEDNETPPLDDDEDNETPPPEEEDDETPPPDDDEDDETPPPDDDEDDETPPPDDDEDNETLPPDDEDDETPPPEEEDDETPPPDDDEEIDGGDPEA